MANTITEQDSLGQAITPEQWATFVLDHLAAESVALASGATRIDTSAKTIHVPRLTSDGSVVWLDELEEIVNDRPEGDDLQLTPRKVGALIVLSNESVSDSNPNVLNATGTAMLRAVALAADRAVFHGEGGKAPTGIIDGTLPTHDGAPTYAGLVNGAGIIRAAGGRPDVAYVNPADFTGLQLEADGMNRPLISGDATQGAPPIVAGLRVFPTPALVAGEALVAQADQLVVAVRQDASVAFSTDARFSSDGTLARVIARLDAGVNDRDGLCVVQEAAV